LKVRSPFRRLLKDVGRKPGSDYRALKQADSRCTDLEPMIENAVKALRDKLEKHLLSSQER
jgi:hypothetical protein